MAKFRNLFKIKISKKTKDKSKRNKPYNAITAALAKKVAMADMLKTQRKHLLF